MTRSAEFGRFSSVVMVSPYSRWAPVSTHARPTHRQRAGTNLGPSGILSIFLTSRRRHLGLRTRTHAAAVAIQLAATAARPLPATKRARQCGLPLVPVDGARRP